MEATHGLAPELITYNAAISACEKGALWRRALELLDQMRARGLEPDVIRCGTRHSGGGGGRGGGHGPGGIGWRSLRRR
jgi:pentatricopeptide repeat protein